MNYIFTPSLTLYLSITTTIFPYVYVVDSEGHKVNVYHEDTGDFLFSFGTFGTGNGQFVYPKGIAIFKNLIYITDSGNHRIQIFTPNGVYVNQIQLPITCYPYGVIVDNSCIIISDYINHSILIYSTDTHEFLLEFGRFGSGDNEFNTPTIIIDEGLYFSIIDEGNDRYVRYSKLDFWTYYNFANFDFPQVNTYSLFIKNPSLYIDTSLSYYDNFLFTPNNTFIVNGVISSENYFSLSSEAFIQTGAVVDATPVIEFLANGEILLNNYIQSNLSINFDLIGYFETIVTTANDEVLVCNLYIKGISTYSYNLNNIESISSVDNLVLLVANNSIYIESNNDFDLQNNRIPVQVECHPLYLGRLTKMKSYILEGWINEETSNVFNFQLADKYGNIGVYTNENERVKFGRGFKGEDYKLRITGYAPMYLKRISLKTQLFNLRRR